MKNLPRRFNLLSTQKEKFCLSFCCNVQPFHCLNHGTTLWANDIQSSLQRERYQTPTLIVLSGAKLFGHVSCSTELQRIMRLVCKHFDFKSADWFSDNLHASSCWFRKQWERNLATQFRRCLWGRIVCYPAVFSVVTLRSSSFMGRSVASGQERLTNPWERLRGRQWVRRTHWSGLCILKPENVFTWASCKDIIVSILWEMNCYF